MGNIVINPFIYNNFLNLGYDVSDPVSVYRTTRPKEWPIVPLPSEVTDAEDKIYIVLEASAEACVLAFAITGTGTIDWGDGTTEDIANTTVNHQYAQTGNESYVCKISGVVTLLNFNVIHKFQVDDNVYNMSNMISSRIVEISGKCNSTNLILCNSSSLAKKHTLLRYFSFSGATSSMMDMFYDCNSLICIPELDTSDVENMRNMFNNCNSLLSIPHLDTSKVTDTQYMFNNCNALVYIPYLNTFNVTQMSYMFNNCNSLLSIPHLDTSKVTAMSTLFGNCYSLLSIPHLDTSKVTNMNYMFTNCYSLVSVPALNTSCVTSMNYMFNNCTSLIAVYVNIKQSVSVSFSHLFSKENLVTILNNLSDATGGTSQTLTLGSVNLAKLTDYDRSIATNKNWTLA